MKRYWLDWLADWQAYWLILNSAPLRWVGAYIRPKSIQPNSIFILFIYFFFRVQIFEAQRGKKINRKTHESIIAVIQWLSMNSICVPEFQCTGMTGIGAGFEAQHCHLQARLGAAGSPWITSSYWQSWCFSSDKEAALLCTAMVQECVWRFTGNIHGRSLLFLNDVSWYLNMVFERSKNAQDNTPKLFHKHGKVEQVAILSKHDERSKEQWCQCEYFLILLLFD